MLGLLLIYKAITVLLTIKITKMPLLNMYLTIGGVKIRVLGYTPEFFFTVAPRSLVGPHFHTLSWHYKEATLLKQLNGLDSSQYKKRPMYWSNWKQGLTKTPIKCM